MKVAIDLTALEDNLSGIERYAACLAREIIEINVLNVILVFKRDVHKIFLPYTKRDNIDIVIIPSCNKFLFNQIRLPAVLNRIQADCYLFLAFPTPWFLKKKNMVCAIHDAVPWDCPKTMTFFSRHYFRVSHLIAIRRCKNIITISEFSKERIMKKTGCLSEKISIVYCGVDSKFVSYQKNNQASIREKYGLPSRYILSLSTIEPRKNMKLLIKAYNDLLNEGEINIPLVLAGRKGWKFKNHISGMVNEVKRYIHFTGFIDDEDLPAVYSMADFFVFPSMYEGFGMPPLEAMACGTPVLSSDAASMPEILGDAAVYFESNHLEDLKTGLVKMIEQVGENNKDLSKMKSRVSLFQWDRESVVLLKLLGFDFSNNR